MVKTMERIKNFQLKRISQAQDKMSSTWLKNMRLKSLKGQIILYAFGSFLKRFRSWYCLRRFFRQIGTLA